MIFAFFAAVSFPNLRLAGPTDADLVDRFQHGDHRSFDEIVRRYQDRVYTLCRRWLDDAQSAEETAQDVFIALYRSLPGFRGESQLSTWVFKVALNHCKNHRMYRTRRGYRRHDSLGPQPDDAPERQLPDPQASSDSTVHRAEAEGLVSSALAQLDEDHRQILLLRDVEDLPYDEIADILDLPRGTVKSRIHRARAELAAILGRKIGREDL